MRVAGAIDIGGTRTKIGLVAENGRVIEKATFPTSPRGDPEPLMDAIVAKFAAVIPSAARNLHVVAIGVSVAGFLDREHASMSANANLPLLVGFPLRRELERRLEHECRLEVDSNAAVVAEYRFGAGHGSKRVLGVTVGTGLGGGVILDGALLRHTGECAGDLGHIIVSPGGRRCTCGSRGCLEAMVCSAALSERAGGRAVREIRRDARRGDKTALDALAETARWLGLGLASLSPLFFPDTIVVGGGIAAAGALILEPVRAAYEAHAANDFRGRVRIVGSTFEGWDGLVGAASLVFDPLPSRPEA